jgi:hypothetical protein
VKGGERISEINISEQHVFNLNENSPLKMMINTTQREAREQPVICCC